MADGNRGGPVLWMLAGIGALALILILAGPVTHGSMMGGMMGGGMTGGFGWVLGLLVVIAVIAVIVMLARRPG